MLDSRRLPDIPIENLESHSGVASRNIANLLVGDVLVRVFLVGVSTALYLSEKGLQVVLLTGTPVLTRVTA